MAIPFGAGDWEAVGLKSPSTVHFHLKGLESAGLITKAEGKTRAITVSGGPGAPEVEAPADKIPVVGSVAAGAPILAEQHIEDYLTFDTGGLSGEHFALKVRGSPCWTRAFCPGTLSSSTSSRPSATGTSWWLCSRTRPRSRPFRRRDGHVWLLPENPEYQPIDGQGAQILGKVVAVVRRYD